jgi:hypothetical protein
MSTHTISIPEGYTYEYLPHGFFISLVGIILGFAVHWICFLVLIAGIMVAASKTGVQIDKRLKKIRKYTSWTFFKTGEWINLKDIVQIELGYDDHDNTQTRVMGQMHASAKTFDMILTFDAYRKVTFNQFIKVGLAFKTLDLIDEIGDIPVMNYVMEEIKYKRNTRTR